MARDRRLVEWHQAGGGSDAFVELYRLHYPRLVRYCRRSLGSDAHLAEDIAQDAFVRALAGLDTLGGERLFYPWLVVIARRLILMHFRRAWRRVAAYERAGAVSVSVIAGPEEAAVDWLTDAPGRARAVEALDRVPARYREVIRLRVWEELSYAEIAERMQITPAAVAPLLHRARAALRREFNTLAPGEPIAALAGFTSALGAALRRVRDRATQWASVLADVGALSVPLAVGLASLSALLTGGTGEAMSFSGLMGTSTGLGLHAPSHAATVAAAEPGGLADATETPAGAFDQPTRLDEVTPSTDTNLGQGVINRPGMGNGLAEVTTGEEARRDQERARAMPHHQQIGPIWWSLDPNQAQQALRGIAIRNPRSHAPRGR